MPTPHSSSLPDRTPPQREVNHQIVVAPDAVPNRRTPVPVVGIKAGGDAVPDRGAHREGLDTALDLTLGLTRFCLCKRMGVRSSACASTTGT